MAKFQIFSFVLINLISLFQPDYCLAQSNNYELGTGFKATESITIGGYFSTEFGLSDTTNQLVFEDLALLGYGELSQYISFLAELETVGVYMLDFKNDKHESHLIPAIERLYLDYSFTENLSIRLGKQIAPIGYWNLQPINVLRETTSHPRYSHEIFPKFLTGLDFYGFFANQESLTYHIYLQATPDLDTRYTSLKIKNHVGLSVERMVSETLSLGGSAGIFTETDDERNLYLQIDGKLLFNKFKIQTEGIFDYQKPKSFDAYQSFAIYTQGEYHFTAQHAAISRIEYFNNQDIISNEWSGTLGYSFRPRFPISFKVEYQIYNNAADNLFLTSFSMLF